MLIYKQAQEIATGEENTHSLDRNESLRTLKDILTVFFDRKSDLSDVMTANIVFFKKKDKVLPRKIQQI